MSTHYEQIKQLILESEADVVKFYEKGNKSAGVRIRRSMQNVKTLAQELRKDVLDKR